MSPSKADFQVVLGQARELVKDQLAMTERVIMQVAENAPAGISDRLLSLFGRKGKRIRSTLLCLIANCGANAPDKDRVAHACASVELLHLASLVHDDIIDGTELRRGQITAHKEWGTQIAVLVGDYVLSQSMRCVIDEEARNIPVIISDAADKLIVGEIMELDHCGEMTLSRGMYNEIIDRKTAALIEAAARIGGIMAGFDKPLVKFNTNGPTCEKASQKSFGHSGFTGAYIWIDPEYECFMVFLTNRTYPTSKDNKLAKLNIRTQIQELFYQAIPEKRKK